MAILFVLDWIQALWYHKKVDIELKANGEEPIPELNYAILSLRYVIRVVLTSVFALLFVTPALNKWITLIICYGIVIYLTRLVETVVRAMIVKSIVRKLEQDGIEPQETQEKETE